MSENSFFFEFQHARLHFTKTGSGEKIMLAFHGYGQTNKDLKDLEQVFFEEYTVYAFDLFYHGESFWSKGDQILTKEFWADLLECFLKAFAIKDFSLLGFSMGGKFVLATLEKYPHRVKEVILIAPDGVKTNFWYNIATYPGVFRKFFKGVVVKPSTYHKLVNTFTSLKILDKGLVRFANTQMQTREQRRRVYYSWMVYRKLTFDLNFISLMINRYRIRITMFLGKYDKIITLKNMSGLLKKVSAPEVHILQAGHSNLIKAVAEFYESNQIKSK